MDSLENMTKVLEKHNAAAKPNSSNKPIIAFILECLDGRGDLEHFKAFALKAKQLFPHVDLVAIIGVWGSNISVCQETVRFLISNPDLFSHKIVYVNKFSVTGGVEFSKTSAEHRKFVENILVKKYPSSQEIFDEIEKKLICIVQVPTAALNFHNDPLIQSWLDFHIDNSKVPLLVYREYGVRNVSHDGGPNVKVLPMGISERCAGIRLVEEWQGEITSEKQNAALMNISHKGFLRVLLEEQEFSLDAVQAYRHKRMLFPAYLQDELSVALFVMTQLNAYLKLENLEGLDFYLPKKHFNIEVMTELLERSGVKKDDWVLIDNVDVAKEYKRPYKVRVFSSDLKLNDQDYKALYYFSNSCAGCSGDDSMSSVLSSLNIPFISSPVHPVKQNFVKDIIAELKALGKAGVPEFKILRKFIELLLTGDISLEFSDRTINCSWAYNVRNSKDFCRSENTLYQAGLPYLEFQKKLILDFSMQLGEYIIQNQAALWEAVKQYRQYLFENHNVFQGFEKSLQALVLKLQKAPVELGQTQGFLAYYNSTLMLLASKQREMLALLNKSTDALSFGACQWKYSSAKNCFWISVRDPKPYEAIIESLDLKKYLLISMVEGKNEHCLMLPANELCSETEEMQAVRTMAYDGLN